MNSAARNRRGSNCVNSTKDCASNRISKTEKGLLQKELAMALNIDVPMYSRIERGDRNAKREQVLLISHLLCIEREELLSLWIADKVNAIIDNENEVADKALKLITKSRYGNKY